MLLMYYSFLSSQNTSVNYWTMVSFIHNGSEMQRRWGIASKPKAQNLKQSNIFKIKTSF